MGPEDGDPEIASQSQLGGVITTGGGFSTYWATPSWQQSAVDDYFSGLSSKETPHDGYNPNGRGYPDVSLIGVWYEIYIQGVLTPIFGTSASSPVFAAMIALVNAKRAENGLPSVGFINPTLYQYGSVNSYFNDVTSGENNCIAYGDTSNPSGATCCVSGFYSTTGWDPVTGYGSVQFDNLYTLFADHMVTDDSGASSSSLSTAAMAGTVIGTLAGVVALL